MRGDFIAPDLRDLRDRLRALGYDARIVNGDCFDVHQGGRIHYLSRSEAEGLADAGAGLDLVDHAEKRGLNYWYSFPTNDSNSGLQ